MATAPQTTSYDRYRIRECRRLLLVPGGSADRLDLGFDQPVSHGFDHRFGHGDTNLKTIRCLKIIRSLKSNIGAWSVSTASEELLICSRQAGSAPAV